MALWVAIIQTDLLRERDMSNIILIPNPGIYEDLVEAAYELAKAHAQKLKKTLVLYILDDGDRAVTGAAIRAYKEASVPIKVWRHDPSRGTFSVVESTVMEKKPVISEEDEEDISPTD